MSKPLTFAGLLPTESTQAQSFVDSHPEYDGDGVVIAILDTGVDPGAFGMQQTSHGLPKLLDIQDCTGSGDVDMKTIRSIMLDEETNEHYVLGKSGKKVYLEKSWLDLETTKEVRVGMKPVYDLFPCDLVDRMKQERKREFAREQNEVEAKVSRNAPPQQHQTAAGAATSAKATNPPNEEPANRVAELKKQMEEYVDFGPVADLIAFQDDEGLWKVSVNGNKPLGEFRVAQEYQKWDETTQLNFGINVFERGNVVSLVMDSGSHGTHVAGIAAACFLDEPHRNGVAPGAQLISLKIGDIRLGGGMETTNAICRALTHCATNGVDVINMSFGESYASANWSFANNTRVLHLMRELVEKHNVTFVASAGNAGPAMSTVSAPGGLLPSLISVGAFVDRDMKNELYALLPYVEAEALNYTWSSRGPALDGNLGVSVSAPGGAIASVPQWTLHGKGLMNGTSMASPNCAGGVALLISALKQQGMKHSPFRIKRALETTALVLRDVEPFAQGHGLIQVSSALELATKAQNLLHFDLPFDVQVFKLGQRGHFMNGVYLRDDHTCKDFDVQIQAKFPLANKAEIGFNLTPTSKMDEINLELAVDLECNSTWVKLPSHHMYLNSQPSVFKLSLDLDKLPSTYNNATVHFAEVLGFDSQNREAGPLFRVPITVVSPQFEDNMSTVSTLQLTLDQVSRRFFKVPAGASWAEVTLQGEDTTTLLAMHCLQTRAHHRFKQDESTFTGRLTNGQVKKRVLVHPGNGGVLEVCICKYWSQDPQINSPVQVKVEFFGYTAPSAVVDLNPSNSYVGAFPICAGLRVVDSIDPQQLELNRQFLTVAPSKALVNPLYAESRNSVLGAFPPDSRILWQLELEYEFTLPQAKTKVRPPRLAMKLNEFLYENFVESQFIQVFDAETKKLIMYSDYVGGTDKEMELKSKGPYLAKAFVRHESRTVLERFEKLPLLVDCALPTPIKLTAYSQPIVSTANVFKPCGLNKNRQLTVFVSLDAAKTLPQSGSYSGAFKLFKDSPVSHVVTLNVQQQEKKKEAPAATAAKKPFDLEETWTVPMIDAKLNALKSLPQDGGADDLFSKEMAVVMDAISSQVKSSAKNKDLTIKALLISLQRAEQELEVKLDQLASVEDLEEVDGSALAKVQQLCQAVRTLDETNETAMVSEIHALLDFQATCGGDSAMVRGSDGTIDALVEKLETKNKTSSKVLYIKLRLAMRAGRFATALQFVDKLLDAEDLSSTKLTCKDLKERKLHLFEQLEWTHIAQRWRERLIVEFPESFPLFA